MIGHSRPVFKITPTFLVSSQIKSSKKKKKSRKKKKKKKTKFTVLKSPHVNKTAQEQFEYRIYKKQLKCFAFQSVLFLMYSIIATGRDILFVKFPSVISTCRK